MTTLRVPSGTTVSEVEQRLEAFLREEWAYYDGISDESPDAITALDVLAPVSVNAYAFGGGAANLRQIHTGLAEACDPLLPQIATEASLATSSPELAEVRNLLHAAVQVRRVLIPVATKVLFRKRRGLIPMLDNVILLHYLDALGKRKLETRTQDSRHAADVALTVLEAFRTDLVACYDQLQELGSFAQRIGFPVGPVRILELLMWTEVEPRGYYRH